MPRKPLLPTADDFFRVVPREQEPRTESTTPPADTPEREPEPEARREPAPSAEAAPVVASAPSAPAKKRASRPRKTRAGRSEASSPPEIAPPAESSGEALEKVTFYLPRSLLKSLEVVRVRVLMDHDTKITRSQIAEAAMAAALTDIDALERLVLEHLAGESQG